MDKLDQYPLMPVIVIEDAGNAKPLAEALLAGGLNIIEVTFRTEAAAESIRSITESFPEMLVGAGTVVTPEQAKQAVEAGSQFGLAPGTDTETISYFQQQQIPFIPGVMTPSDIQTAVAAGCRRLKFFPAGAAGGCGMLKAIAAPYANLGIKYCPTGGVTLENMSEYLAVSHVFAVGGSWLATPAQIQNQEWDAITTQVREAVELAAKFKADSAA